MQDSASCMYIKTNSGDPVKVFHSNKKPWFNSDCYNARTSFKKARNKFSHDKSNAELRQEYITAKSNYNRIKRINKNKYKRMEKEKLTNLSKNQPREFWKKVKNQYKKQPPVAEKLNVSSLHDHFKTLYSTDSETQDYNIRIETNDDYLDKEITLTELKDAVYSQNNNKSSGLDNIIAEIYKATFPHISQFLLKLYNHIFTTGEYPQSFGEGIIVPIFKGGDIEEPKNYRGVTLINILSKIYSQILLNRLTKWSIVNEKIVDNQFGFQKGKSTIDCIFILHSVIAKTLSTKNKLYCCFVDYEKCFDKISSSHLHVYHKVINENVSKLSIRGVFQK